MKSRVLDEGAALVTVAAAALWAATTVRPTGASADPPRTPALAERG